VLADMSNEDVHPNIPSQVKNKMILKINEK
jgi:hypothetical protein